MTHFIIEEDDVMPDYSDLDDLPVPDASLDGHKVSFDQIRHELDQMFESDAIQDMDSPEAIVRVMENATYAFNL